MVKLLFYNYYTSRYTKYPSHVKWICRPVSLIVAVLDSLLVFSEFCQDFIRVPKPYERPPKSYMHWLWLLVFLLERLLLEMEGFSIP
jgi:hypothetical protein